jgi:capsular exopolysaccharide synthesis family protein
MLSTSTTPYREGPSGPTTPPRGSRTPPRAAPPLEERLVSLGQPWSLEADQYRMLRCEIEYLRRSRDLSVIAVTSPGVGDGKTTTAVNLAGTLSQDPQARVLLVDADLRRPSAAPLLGFNDRGDGPGLAGAILDLGRSLASVVRPRPPFNLSVLPAGRSHDLPFELLRSPRVGDLLAEARQQFDYVVVDTPPLLLLPDCRALSQRVDGFLLVVAAHKTSRRALAASLTALEEEKTIGIVFNNEDTPPQSQYKRYYGAGAGPQVQRAARREGGRMGR